MRYSGYMTEDEALDRWIMASWLRLPADEVAAAKARYQEICENNERQEVIEL